LKNKYILFVILIFISVSIIFSIKWLKPLFLKSGEFSTYTPIRYSPKNLSDDYFYFSYAREFLNGNFSAKDPITYEHSRELTAHSTYLLSYFFMALGGFVNLSTNYAYYFCYLVYPFLNIMLIFIFTAIFVENIRMKLLISLVSVFIYAPHTFFFNPYTVIRYFNIFYHAIHFNSFNLLHMNELFRIPNILITNIQLFSLSILLFLGFIKNKENKVYRILYYIVLASSAYVSIQNFIISWSIEFFRIILLKKDQVDFKDNLKYIFFALILSILGIYRIYYAQEYIYSILEFAIPGDNYTSWDINRMKDAIIIIIPVLILLFFIKNNYKKIIITIMCGVTLAYFVFLSFGTYAANKIVSRGAEILYSNISLIVIYLFCKKITEKIKIKKKIIKAKNIIIDVSIIILIIVLVRNQIHSSKLQDARFDKNFTDLYCWTNKNTSRKQTFVSLDFDLVVNLPVYSVLNSYIPQVILSAASTEERFERFIEVILFYNIKEKDFRKMMENIISHYKMNELKNNLEINSALMQLALYYGKYSNSKIDEKEINRLLKKYHSIKKVKHNLKYKADYLILSGVDKELIAKNIYLMMINEEKLVYKNGNYEVYKLF
jgi:hypothetical protein